MVGGVTVGSGGQPSSLPPLQRPLAPPMRPVTPSSSTPSMDPLSKKKGIVELNSEGWVIGACVGRARWLVDLQEEVTRWLDLSVPKFLHQDPGDWRNVIESMTAKWDYVGHPVGISTACIERHATSILKNDRYKLHDIWKKGGCNPAMPAPGIVDVVQWSKLLRHFQSESLKKSSEKATIARGNVTNPNLMGRTGYSSVAEKLVWTLTSFHS